MLFDIRVMFDCVLDLAEFSQFKPDPFSCE